jgi:hypothetical protein
MCGGWVGWVVGSKGMGMDAGSKAARLGLVHRLCKSTRVPFMTTVVMGPCEALSSSVVGCAYACACA